jgi:hypothetical protein
VREYADPTVVLVCGDVAVVSWPWVLRGRRDLEVIDALARLQLAARRVGCTIRLRDVCPELSELLHLTGLTEVLRVEVGRQSEGGEQLGVEEVGAGGDLAT